MSDLLELAARCEAATGPDREIDRDIGLALGLYDQPEDLGCFQDPAEGVVSGGGQTYAALFYTASLDAAMTLVPEGWHWQIGIFNLDGKGRAQLAEQVETEFGTAIGVRQQSTAATPTLALCAAALKARASQ